MKKYKQNRKLVTIKCDGCQIEFSKPESEYKRNLSKNRRNFCSRSCIGKHNHNHLENFIKPDISKYSNNRKNIYTPYKYYMKGVKQRFHNYNITLEDLKIQWEKQNEICPYSGIKLKLSTHNQIIKNKIICASLDRIDSSKGYITGNIQFVSQAINYMKNNMSHEETIILCKLIANNYK